MSFKHDFTSHLDRPVLKMSILKFNVYLVFICFSLHFYGSLGEFVLLKHFLARFKGFMDCDSHGKDMIRWTNVTLTSKNRNPYASGTFRLNEPYSDQIMMRINIGKITSNGWIDYYKISMGPACTGLKKLLPEIYKRIIEVTKDKKCPLRTGNHTVNNIPATLKLNIPYAPLNTYKAETIFEKEGERVGCLQAVVEIVPDKSVSRNIKQLR